MIEQEAIVVSVDGGQAWIKLQPGIVGKHSLRAMSRVASACLTSAACQKMRVLNPVYARPGETVVVGMHDHGQLIQALLNYLLPLFIMLGCAVVLGGLSASMGLGELAGTVLGGITGLVVGLHLSKSLYLRPFPAGDSQPVILRVQGLRGYPYTHGQMGLS